MKKSNRIARKPDSAPRNAQAKRPDRNPDKLPNKPCGKVSKKPREASGFVPIAALGEEIACLEHQRLIKDGAAFMLKTEWPQEKLEPLTREQARAWLDEKVICAMIPHEFRRDFRHRESATNHASGLCLGELLRDDQISGLNALGADGIPIQKQVEGAIASWLSYAEHMKETNPNAAATLKEASGVLTWDRMEDLIKLERGGYLTATTVKFFLGLVRQADQMPLQQAIVFLDGICDLIEYHPGLADEREALEKMLEGQAMIGNSAAAKTHLHAA